MSTSQPRVRRWWVPVAVLAAAALLITVILVVNSGSEDSTAAQDGATQSEGAPGGDSAGQQAPAESGTQNREAATEVQGPESSNFSDAESRDGADLQADGPVDAPVVLVIFSDYQCPFCATWSQDTLPVMRDYADRGDLRIEWRDVNVFGSDSEQAAKAAHAAAHQDAYWDYHDALFAGGEHRSADDLTPEALTELAGSLGLDTSQFAEDMGSDTTEAAISDYAELGIDLGAFSTPSFIVGGEPIVGAQPTEVFVDAVDRALDVQG